MLEHFWLAPGDEALDRPGNLLLIALQVDEARRPRRDVAVKAHAACQQCPLAVIIEQVEQSEWHVEGVFFERGGRTRACLLGGLHLSSSRADLAQRFQLSLADHSLGRLGNGAEDAAYASIFHDRSEERRVGKE